MKLKKYEDKNIKRRKVVLISLGVIVLISVSFLLYKTFASFTESAEFQVMKGKVDYFGNSDVYFAFYEGDNQLDEMPLKDNEESLVFDHGECDNGASIIWDSEAWGPMVKNLSKSKTKCSLYFTKGMNAIEYIKNLTKVSNTDLSYDGEEILGELGTVDNNLRYIGVNPNNYVSFNNEIWRIIGIMKIKNENNEKVERIKIIRQDGIEGQKNFGNYSFDYNNSTDYVTSTLKNMLNGIYYNSASGDCYKTLNQDDIPLTEICDFSGNANQPKGLDEIARMMIDKNVIWNIGGWDTSEVLTSQMYEYERGTTTYLNNNHIEWTIENDKDYHNGIGLMYPSDYGYAVGESERNSCLNTNLNKYGSENCGDKDWLKPSRGGFYWSLTPRTSHSHLLFGFYPNGVVFHDNGANYPYSVWPVVYILPNINIELDLSDNYGSVDNPFRLKL